MMKYDNEQLTDKSTCAGVRADLKMCLLESDCCKIVSIPQYTHFDIFHVVAFTSPFIFTILAQKDSSRVSQFT